MVRYDGDEASPVSTKLQICPRHGSKFDVTTGKCITGPKIGFLKLKAEDEVVFEVKVEYNKIKINMP
jgi:nitrite reductase/ring-hydroxylating ferredoxin subunit